MVIVVTMVIVVVVMAMVLMVMMVVRGGEHIGYSDCDHDAGSNGDDDGADSSSNRGQLHISNTSRLPSFPPTPHSHHPSHLATAFDIPEAGGDDVDKNLKLRFRLKVTDDAL